jgi:fucose 4-O-acetylase-like acetyltransferase
MRVKPKLYFIDNIRIVLTVLVVLHHCLITYGAAGGWYFRQPSENWVLRLVLTFFVATNQSFFMGLFFFISGYFVPASYKRKGWRAYLRDRLKRLGIPLVFYSIVLSPSLNYIAEHYGYHRHHSFVQYMSGYHHWIDFGVLWFLAALLVFDLGYIAFGRRILNRPGAGFPTQGRIFVFSLVLAIVSYLVRLVFPIGWVLQPLGFQLAHFPQYIALFTLGTIASGQDWLGHLDRPLARRSGMIAVLTTLLLFPVLTGIWINMHKPGPSAALLQSLEVPVYALWEQVTGIHIMVALLGHAKVKWNSESRRTNSLARESYGVYIFHPLVLITVALLFTGLPIEPALKVLVVGPLAVGLCYLLVRVLLKVPLVSKVI